MEGAIGFAHHEVGHDDPARSPVGNLRTGRVGGGHPRVEEHHLRDPAILARPHDRAAVARSPESGPDGAHPFEGGDIADAVRLEIEDSHGLGSARIGVSWQEEDALCP